MSGGHYDYGYAKVFMLADDIEAEWARKGKYKTEDYSNDNWQTKPVFIERDYFEDWETTKEDKEFILEEIKGLVKDLRNVSARARALEWLMSGDYSPETYIETIKELKNNKY